MKKVLQKRAVAIGCILLALGLVISGASFAAMGFSLKAFSSPRSPVADPETYSFTGDEVAAVEIESGFRKIRVEGVAGLKAPELTVSPDVFEYQLEAGTEGPKVVVRETEKAKNNGWRWFQLFTYQSSVNSDAVLRLPQDYSGSLRLKSNFGAVRIEGLSSLERVYVESSNESVRITDVVAKEDVEVTSSFGDITLKNSGARSFSVQDANGGVQVEGCHAQEAAFSTEFGGLRVQESSFDTLVLENSNGDSKVDNVEVKESLRYHSSFGGLKFRGLKCPDLELRSENGGIDGTLLGAEQDYKISANVKYGDTNLQGRLEGKNRLEVESDFGDVKIRFEQD